jgi:hypothetical protein
MDITPDQADSEGMSQGDYNHSNLLAEVDEALSEQPKTFRQEMRDLINAPKGSDAAKARSGLGWMLILFGLIGVPVLILVIGLAAWVISSIVGGIGLLF